MISKNESIELNVSIIIVTFNSKSHIEKILEILFRDRYTFQLIIIDNNSNDGTTEWLKSLDHNIKLLANENNTGFASAVNQAAELVTNDYILLLNPDAIIQPEQIQKLKMILESEPTAAAIGPRLVYPDGRIQPSRGSFPNLAISFAHIFGLKRLMPSDEKIMASRGRILGKIFRQYTTPKQLEKVDYTTGACVLIRSDVFRDMKGLDERFFLYYEEIDFAFRLQAGKYKWLYTDEIRVCHNVAESSRRVPLLAFEARYKSMFLYFHKNKNLLSVFAVWSMISLMAIYHLVVLFLSPSRSIGGLKNRSYERKVLTDLILMILNKKNAVSNRSIPLD